MAIDVAVVKPPASLVVIALIPILVAIMWFIHHEYDTAAKELEIDHTLVLREPRRRNRVIIPIPGLPREVIQSVQFGRSFSDDVRAVHMTIAKENAEQLQQDWEHRLPGVPLIIIETPYRSLVTPFLHDQRAPRIKKALVGRADTVVAEDPYAGERRGSAPSR